MREMIDQYGWIVIALLIVCMLIALVSPLTTFIADKVAEYADDLNDIPSGVSDQNLPYLITIHSNISDGGVVSLIGQNSGTQVYLIGENTINFIATTNSGYRFIGWYVDNQLISEDLIADYDVSERTTITARFEKIS